MFSLAWLRGDDEMFGRVKNSQPLTRKEDKSQEALCVRAEDLWSKPSVCEICVPSILVQRGNFGCTVPSAPGTGRSTPYQAKKLRCWS